MPDDHGFALAKRVQQPDHVADQVEHRVLVDRLGGVGLSVAAHVGRHDPVAGLGQGNELVPPRVPRLRKAVAEQHERALARLGQVHLDAVRLDALVLDLDHGPSIQAAAGEVV